MVATFNILVLIYNICYNILYKLERILYYMSKTIKLGLIRGRHEMPVDDYVPNSVKDVMDFEEIERKVFLKLSEVISLKLVTDNTAWSYNVNLVIYVTGLSSVMAAVIKYCAKMNINLTLMHYNIETHEYKPQIIF